MAETGLATLETSARPRRSAFVIQHNRKSSAEWYTPPAIFRALALSFDLDPCQPPGGIAWIPARRYFALPVNGLAEPWVGRVWLNPPYGPHMAKWISKWLDHKNGVALLSSRITGTQVGQSILRRVDAICFVRGRVEFVGSNAHRAGFDSMLLAMGAVNVSALVSSQLGVVVQVKTDG